MSFTSSPDVEPERGCKEETRTQHEAVLNAAEAACRREVPSNLSPRNAEQPQDRDEDCEHHLGGQVRVSITYMTMSVYPTEAGLLPPGLVSGTAAGLGSDPTSAKTGCSHTEMFGFQPLPSRVHRDARPSPTSH